MIINPDGSIEISLKELESRVEAITQLANSDITIVDRSNPFKQIEYNYLGDVLPYAQELEKLQILISRTKNRINQPPKEA